MTVKFAALMILAAALAAVYLRWAFWPSARLPRFRVRVMRVRLRLRLHPGRGHATAAELCRRWGRLAAWRRSGRSRRSLSAWQRLRHPAEHSIFLGRAQHRHGLRVPLEEHGVIIAPPRTGKTGLLASIVLHYPGPVLSTTTKHDVAELTIDMRARTGPVHVFNPQGIGGIPSTFRWSPVEGCQDPAVAIRRADAFANAVRLDGDNAFFQHAARGYLRAMFHAAAMVTGGGMQLVSRWALTATKGGAEPAEYILRRAGAVTWADELGQLRGAAERTSATNEIVLGQMLGFMSDPALAEAVIPAEGDAIDLTALLRERGTVYLIADSDHDESPLAPLFACLASELHYTAALEGSKQPGGRLDPPLLMALDEIVQTCPVPVDKWTADSGGKGIQIFTVAHGEAQLVSRWAEHGKQVILDTAGVKVILPGITDASTLETLSKLCGHAALMERGQEHYSRHEVMTPDMIRMLPDGRALIIRRNCSPVVAKLPRAWKDRAAKRARGDGGGVLATLSPLPRAPLAAAAAAQVPARAPVARLRPAADGAAVADGRPEVAEVLPADDTPRPWRSR